MGQPAARRSVSLDRHGPGNNLARPQPGGFPGQRKQTSRMDQPPIRTSTALGGSRNSIFF